MGLRQARKYTGEPIAPDVLEQILEVARWTGSSKNSQPWHLILVDDRELLRHLAQARPMNSWAADASVAIVIVMPRRHDVVEAWDEGRMTERIMLAAASFGLGSATAWFVDEEAIAKAHALLSVPDDARILQMITLGPTESGSVANLGGRKPLDEIVSRNRFGQKGEGSNGEGKQ